MTNLPNRIVIGSDYTELKTVEKSLKEIFREYGISKKHYNKVFLCISEAVRNSIEHGNSFDVNKKVFVSISCREDYFHIEVVDEGCGFNIKEVPDPTKPENIKKESGRGIHIIRTMSESFSYEKQDSRLLFKIECK